MRRQYLIRDLDRAALQSALTDLRARHEALRTRLIGSGPRLAQEVSEPGTFPVEWMDDDGSEPADAPARPADQEVLARVWPRRAGGALVLDIDHLLADAWSATVIGAELAHLYTARRQGRESQLPPVGRQYRHFAERQLSRLSGDGLTQLQDAWLDRLAGAEAVRLPRPAARVPRRQRVAAIQYFRGGREAAQALSVLGASAGTTSAAAAIAVFFLALSLVSEQDDISIGSIVANRADVANWRTVGSFAHLVPLRLVLGADLSVRELLRRSHEMMTHALAYQELPMSLLPAGALSKDTAVGVNSIVMNILTPPAGANRGVPSGDPGLTPAPAPLLDGARFDLELALFPPSEKLGGFVRYATDRFSAEWAAEFRALLAELIQAAAADTDVTLGQLKKGAPGRVEYLQSH